MLEDEDFEYEDGDEYGGEEEEYQEEDAEEQNEDDIHYAIASASSSIGVDREADFKIIPQSDISSILAAKLDEVSSVLNVPTSHVRILLMAYGWNSEKLLNDYYEDSAKVFKKALLRDPEAAVQRLKASPPFGGDKMVSCITCLEEYEEEKMTKAPGCDHVACNDCWTAYVTGKVQEGLGRNIMCMGFKCSSILNESFIVPFLSGEVLDKFNEQLLNSYVDDNPKFKWCPSVPHCGNCAKVEFSETLAVTVKCTCGHLWCFKCSEGFHSPASCEMVRLWRTKASDGSADAAFMDSQTKPCPKCHQQVFKDGGCNLVYCRCKQAFCWQCGQMTGTAHTWEKIEGHTCGRFKEEYAAKASIAERNLKRWTHHHDRYIANLLRDNLVSKMRVDLNETIAHLRLQTATLTHNLEKCEKALNIMVHCRRAIAWSFVFAFFLFDPDNGMFGKVSIEKNSEHKGIFDHNLEILEKETEKLARNLQELIKNKEAFVAGFINQSGFPTVTPAADGSQALEIEKSLEKLVNDIQMSASMADKTLSSLFDIVRTDILGSGAYSFNISPHRPFK